MPRFARCPECGCRYAQKVSFTWWGGIIGPMILNHVQCEDCGTAYNGTTGRSNNTGIAIYCGVGFGIGFLALGCVCAGIIASSMH